MKLIVLSKKQVEKQTEALVFMFWEIAYTAKPTSTACLS